MELSFQLEYIEKYVPVFFLHLQIPALRQNVYFLVYLKFYKSHIFTFLAAVGELYQQSSIVNFCSEHFYVYFSPASFFPRVFADFYK